MIRVSVPSDELVRAHVRERARLPFSYAAVGATRDPLALPRGYRVDRQRVELGRGDRAFAQACSALRSWRMFSVGWVRLYGPDAPIVAGTTVGVLARAYGLVALSTARIVYTIDESQRLGFAYGTLPGHVGRGEERFLIECDRDGRVWYDVFAFSRPGLALMTLGRPLMRRMQARFRADSCAAMQRAIGE